VSEQPARRARWTNWGGNQSCAPAAVARPRSTREVSELVREAARSGARVKAVGSGHSFTGAACTSGVHVRLDAMSQVLWADPDSGRARVQAGITPGRLNRELASRGLALENLGDISYQTLAGAVSTSTHGTGLGFGGLASQVEALELVAADGTVLSCSADEEPEVFAAARVGVGALGILTEATLRCVPAFRLAALEQPMRVDEVVGRLDELVESNEHFEFFWVPHTGWALTKANNRTDAPPSPRRLRHHVLQRAVLENLAFGAACRLGRARPEWVPRLATLAPSGGRSEFVDRSDRVFTSPRWVRFCEMEYSVPRHQAAAALARVRQVVEESGLRVSFPVEVRFSAPDDAWLSTSYGRQSCYVAVHMYRGVPYQQYFEAVEQELAPLEGRPHWGKVHFLSAAELAPRYPCWDAFQAVRRRLDPEGLFANPYTDRVLGPPAPAVPG